LLQTFGIENQVRLVNFAVLLTTGPAIAKQTFEALARYPTAGQLLPETAAIGTKSAKSRLG